MNRKIKPNLSYMYIWGFYKNMGPEDKSGIWGLHGILSQGEGGLWFHILLQIAQRSITFYTFFGEAGPSLH